MSACYAASGKQLEAISCGSCGLEFAIPVDMYRRRVNDLAWFWCPNGHQIKYSGPTEADRLRHELATAKSSLEVERSNRKWTERCAKGANIAAGKAKAARRRLEHRVANGVCPCCNRTFQNLARHMLTKHPVEASK